MTQEELKNVLIENTTKDNIDYVKELLEQDIDVAMMNGIPLFRAAINGYSDIVKLLLEYGGPYVNSEVTRAVFIMVLLNENTHITKLFLEHGPYINAADKFGRTELMRLSDIHKVESIKLLLENGASVNMTDRRGNTALIYSCASDESYDGVEIVNLLLEHGADIDAVDNSGRTALTRAVETRKHDTVELLLEKGANIEAVTDSGRTALILAVETGEQDTVELLLDKGADLKAKTDDGRTALIMASIRGYQEIVELLLDNGANIKEIDIDTTMKEINYDENTASMHVYVTYNGYNGENLLYENKDKIPETIAGAEVSIVTQGELIEDDSIYLDGHSFQPIAYIKGENGKFYFVWDDIHKFVGFVSREVHENEMEIIKSLSKDESV